MYFLSDTWVNVGHTKEKEWVEISIRNPRPVFTIGLPIGLKNPAGKGKRLIIVHVQPEDCIEGGLLHFESQKR